MSDFQPEQAEHLRNAFRSREEIWRMRLNILENASIFRTEATQLMGEFALGTTSLQWAYYEMLPTCAVEPEIEDQLRPRDGVLIMDWPYRMKGIRPNVRLLTNEVFWQGSGVSDVMTKDIMVDRHGSARRYISAFRSAVTGVTSGDAQAASFSLSPSKTMLLAANLSARTPTSAITELAWEDRDGTLYSGGTESIRPFGYNLCLEDCLEALNGTSALLQEMKALEPTAVGRAADFRRFILPRPI